MNELIPTEKDIKNKIKEFEKLSMKIESKLLRDSVFKPFGVALLGYQLNFGLFMNLPTCAIVFDLNKIFMNIFYKPISDLNEQYLTFYILHEICHYILGHRNRMIDKKWISGLANIAKDIEVENFIWKFEQLIKTEKYRNMCSISIDSKNTPDNVVSEEYDNMLAEEIYEKLKKDGKYENQEKDDKLSSFVPGLSNEFDKDVTVSQTSCNIRGRQFSQTSVRVKSDDNNSNETKEQKPDSDIDKKRKQIEDSTDKAINTSRHMMQEFSKDIGIDSQDLKLLIERLFVVEIPWDEILMDLVTVYVRLENEVTWSRQRLSSFCNPILPELPGYDDDEIFPTVVYANDESSSISEKDMQRTLNVILQSKNYFEELIVIRHSVDIAPIERYKSDEIGEKEQQEICTRKQCGGTSHEYVFKEVKRLYEEEDNIISCLICITDLWSDILKYQHIIPQDIPVIYIVTNDYNKDILKELNGKSIIIND